MIPMRFLRTTGVARLLASHQNSGRCTLGPDTADHASDFWLPAVELTLAAADLRVEETGKCQQCKGTGHVGYPGFGPVDRFPNHCFACYSLGDCPSCRGTGQR
jgi:hypothetical protein